LKNEGEEIKYEQFTESFEGVIESHLAHHRYYAEDVWELWRDWKDSFKPKI